MIKKERNTVDGKIQGGGGLDFESRRRDKEKIKFLFMVSFIIIVLAVAVNLVLAQERTFCCEQTTGGAWCQNAEESQCDTGFRKAPASCDATSFCRLGTCIDSQEGICTENSPERVCNDNGGVWEEGEPDEIPQCQLGCCLLGDQASFVTQTRCKRLSSVFGLETNFRTDIQSEVACIASATSDVKGACVFERDFEKTCSFTTKRDCAEISLSSPESSVDFREGFLCSDESLGTNCGPTERTTCLESEDEVYFVDSCGNLANIYDASKIDNKEYWSKVKTKAESCGAGNSNADSATCGNCDYFLGSTCKAFDRGEDRVRPNFGDNICRDLSCEFEGNKFEHGETWCADSSGSEEALPGSRSFRAVCFNGDVSIEPCADFRQESCIENDVNGFTNAACRVNRWQDCISQDEQSNCENSDRRDCQWLEVGEEEYCVPFRAPGFNFWEEGDAEGICSIANTECIVKYEKKIGGDKECVDNCHCLDSSWENELNGVCTALGDCGNSVNFIGVEGYGNSVKISSEDEDDDE